MYSNEIIGQNWAKLFFYMLILTIVMVSIGYFASEAFGFGVDGVLFFLILACIINFISYFFSDSIVIKTTGAKPLKKEEYPEYYDMVEGLVQRNNLKMPKLYILETNAMNAFATGRNKEKSLVAVTRGLLDNLTLDEVSGVVGHELSHIQNGDMLLMSAVAVIAGFISLLSNNFRYSMFYSRRNNSNAIIALIISIVAPITALLIQLAISRSREYMADAKGAEICGNPEYLANALRKIKGDSIQMPDVNPAVNHLFISSPFKDDLFSTHPDINDRINRLDNMSIKIGL